MIRKLEKNMGTQGRKETTAEHSKQRSVGETCTNLSIRKEKVQGVQQWK